VRELVTTLLEVLGLLLLAAGGGLLTASVSSPAAGLMFAGSFLITSSWLATRPRKGDR
jgi:hypothetical protein